MYLKGASVVPFFRYDGQIYLILGRERADSNWSGSTRWSGFGGSALPHETSAETATREFAEESMHMPCFRNLKRDLAADDFALKVVAHAGRTYYVTYVKEIACDWESCLRHTTAVRVCAAQVAAIRRQDTTVRRVVVDNMCWGNDVPISADQVRIFQAQRSRDAALVNLKSVCPSMAGFHDATLEKDLVACWPLDELRAALRCGARQTFRRCFVPTLHTILQEFGS